MAAAVHYTTPEGWKGIQAAGSLRPATRLTEKYLFRFAPLLLVLPARSRSRLRRIATVLERHLIGARYVYLFPEDEFHKWSGRPELADTIQWLQAKAVGERELVRLCIEIPPSTRAFVTDEVHWWRARDAPVESRALRQSKRAYLRSRTPLATYDGSYTLPVIVIPDELPAACVHRVEPVDTEAMEQDASVSA